MLTDDHPPMAGGVAAWTGAVTDALVADGHDVRVFARHREDLEPIAGTRTVGVRGPSFGRRGGAWLGWRAMPSLARADRVLATTWPVATLAARMGLPLAVVAHGSDLAPRLVSTAVCRRTFSLSSRRFAVSRWLADRVPGGALVLPSPVDAAPHPARLDSGTWAFVGRALRGKGGDRFVRWVARAGVRGLMVGDGPELEAWRRLARVVGARIRFTGALRRDEVRALISVVDLVCLPARATPDGMEEGLGLVLLEAAAAGVPAVGTAVGGVPEALGPAGLVVEEPDDAGRAVAAIRAWWSRERGEQAWAWCRAVHGSHRTARAVLS
ncbi:MAG: glycosyltransferase family 4 protein [Alphaproteobacteria bacterium]|nr:glycosyltransferase family 4 protein [Alphaproteobacteria bacterium]MCB9697857.1 glycosyltransferase family 4 protein [Alphaproteobacteria bacterium]